MLLSAINVPSVAGHAFEAAVLASIEWEGLSHDAVSAIRKLFPDMEEGSSTALRSRMTVTRFCSADKEKMRREHANLIAHYCWCHMRLLPVGGCRAAYTVYCTSTPKPDPEHTKRLAVLGIQVWIICRLKRNCCVAREKKMKCIIGVVCLIKSKCKGKVDRG